MNASGQLKRLAYVIESVWGTTPASSPFNVIRHTNDTLAYERDSYVSQEIRSDRMVGGFRLGSRRSQGDIEVEFSLGSHDDLILAALGGAAWDALADTGSISLQATASGAVYTRTTGSFLTDGFDVGDEVTVSGFSNSENNGRKKVKTVAALTMSVQEALVDEASSSGRSIAIVGSKAKVGSVMTSFTIERGFTDINRFQAYKGMVVNGLSMDLRAGGQATGRFNMLGDTMADAGATLSNGTFNELSANAPFASFDGMLYEGDAAIAIVTSLQFALANGRQGVGVIGAPGTPQIFEGTSNLTGTLTALLPDSSLLSKFVDETDSSIDVLMNDTNDTDFHRIRIPLVRYTGGQPQPPKEGPVVVNLPFQALYDPNSGSSIIWQRSNA